MAQITFFPVVEREDQLIDLVSRAAWFLSFAAADRIHLPVADAALAATPWRVAPGMDPTIASRFEALRDKLVTTVAGTVEQLEACMQPADVILRWRKDARPAFVPAALLAQWETGKKVFQVDPAAIRQEGSFYIEAGLHLLRDRQALVDESRAKFEALTARLGRFERAYLMATGPSVAGYRQFDYDRALTIVCNSVILDEELMATARPKVLTFADPIFHFGPSQYAGAFREKLRASLAAHDLTIVIPFKYYALFVSAMPELRERTIGVPFDKDRAFNFDLRSDFTLKTTANILTFLMLPLAATFADEVAVLGCDGRPLSENSYFWNHNPSTQINDKMANIRAVHPGFFAIDYNDYYLEHCETLETLLREGEAQGKRFVSVGFSHIPALRSRSGRGRRATGDGPGGTGRKDVVIIDPDATGWSGHYMAYNDKLSQAMEALGCQVRVLCHRRIDPDILVQRPQFVPLLDTHSWSVGQAKSPEHAIRTWTGEIGAAVRRLPLDAPATVFYLYTGSLEHAVGLAALTQRWPSIHVHVNLFYLSFRDTTDGAWVERWRPFMDWLDKAGPRFVVTVPTREVQAEVLDIFGVLLDVAPHPSTGVADDRLAHPPAPRGEAAELQVIFPGAPRLEKGYLDTLDCVRLLGDQPGIRTLLRHSPTASTPEELRELPSDLPGNAAAAVGELSNEAFEAMFAGGDIVVLPYTPDAFAKRTSGLLIDALYHGLPAVVVDGTWLAALVRRHGCGVVVPDAMPASLRDGVLQIAADIGAYRERVRTASQRYFRANTWRALADFVLRPLTAPVHTPRLLCIDLTGLDAVTATGRVKEAFFLGWPADRFLLASRHTPSERMRLIDIDGLEVAAPASTETLLAAIRAFRPELVYYRAVDNDDVHAFAKTVLEELGLPYVIHMMDDWPERLRRNAPDRHAMYDEDLRHMLADARACLSISDAMSAAFEARYGVPFLAFANAIDPAAFAPRKLQAHQDGGLRIVYTGALAKDMNFQSVKDLADLLPRLQGVTLDIYTREPWLTLGSEAFSDNPAVKVHKQVPAADYYALLQRADALLIAYNFDEASKAYVGLSKANKMPEYLASGTPVIAYGPAGMATIDELVAQRSALTVTHQDPQALETAIGGLIASIDQRRELAARARASAFERLNVWHMSRAFRAVLAAAGDSAPPASAQSAADALIGPYGRGANAHWDETQAVARLLSPLPPGSVMIDVGAHHGSALMHFLRRGWKVLAFEPDLVNRAALLENLAAQTNRKFEGQVEIDARAVSNENRSGMPFYRSAQSTGISGLSAFHASHEQQQTVDTVTLADALAGKPVTQVDFLKIDTEGHDLKVLQGFPWQRFKPKVIECEFEDAKTVPLGYRFDDLAAYLVALGYSVYVSEWHPIVRYGVRHDWRRLLRYPCRLADPKSWGNLIAFLDPIDDERLVDATRAVLQLGSDKAALRPVNQPMPAAAPPMAMLHLKRIEVDTRLEPAAPDRWRLTTTDAPDGKPCSWRAVFNAAAIARRDLCGSLRIVANHRVSVQVALSSDGHSPHEGTRQTVTLDAGVPQVVMLRHRFAGAYETVRLQVKVVSRAAAGFELGITEPRVHETLASIEPRIAPAQMTLEMANRLFREGDFATAMCIYLRVGEQIPLRLFSDNALTCARRMKLSPSDDIHAIKTLLG